MKVVAFDPGVTTGYAMGDISEDGEMLVATGQAKWSEKDLHNNLEWYKPDYIVYESFEYRNRARKGLELFSRNLIGVIELYASVEDIRTHTQSPANVVGRYSYFDNRKLKELDLYKPGQIHANEACKHLLYWFNFGPGYKWNTKGVVSGSHTK